MQDTKLRGASKAAKDIRSQCGAPQDMAGTGPTYPQPFSTTNDLMPAEIQYTTRPSGMEEIRANQHAIFTAPSYGRGGFVNPVDGVDRTDFPNAPVLEAQFNGQGEQFTPPSAANVSTMSRPPHKPSRIPRGSFSTTGNKHPL
jgi:hypothetical protein